MANGVRRGPASGRTLSSRSHQVQFQMDLQNAGFIRKGKQSQDSLRDIEASVRSLGTTAIHQFDLMERSFARFGGTLTRSLRTLNTINNNLRNLNKNVATLNNAAVNNVAGQSQGSGSSGPPPDEDGRWTAFSRRTAVAAAGAAAALAMGKTLAAGSAETDVLLEGLSTQYNIDTKNAAASRNAIRTLRKTIGGNTTYEESAKAYQVYAQMTRREDLKLGGVEQTEDVTRFGKAAYRTSRGLGVDQGMAADSLGEFGIDIKASRIEIDKFSKSITGLKRETVLSGDQILKFTRSFGESAAQYGKRGQEAIDFTNKALQLAGALSNVGVSATSLFGAAKQNEDGSDEAFIRDIKLGFSPYEEVTQNERTEALIRQSKNAIALAKEKGGSINSPVSNLVLGKTLDPMFGANIAPGLAKQLATNSADIDNEKMRLAGASATGEGIPEGKQQVYDSIPREFAEAGKILKDKLMIIAEPAFESSRSLAKLAQSAANAGEALDALPNTAKTAIAGAALVISGAVASLLTALAFRTTASAANSILGAGGTATAGAGGKAVLGRLLPSLGAAGPWGGLALAAGTAGFVLNNKRKEYEAANMAAVDSGYQGSKEGTDNPFGNSGVIRPSKDFLTVNPQIRNLRRLALEHAKAGDHEKAAKVREQVRQLSRTETGGDASIVGRDVQGPKVASNFTDSREKNVAKLKEFAAKYGLEITDDYKSEHNKGSRHATGHAIDFRTSGMSDEKFQEIMAAAKEAGFIGLDERKRPKGQAKWTGPHGHLQYSPDQIAELKRNASDVYDDPSSTQATEEGTKEVSVNGVVQTSDVTMHREVRNMATMLQQLSQSVSAMVSKLGPEQRQASNNRPRGRDEVDRYAAGG